MRSLAAFNSYYRTDSNAVPSSVLFLDFAHGPCLLYPSLFDCCLKHPYPSSLGPRKENKVSLPLHFLLRSLALRHLSLWYITVLQLLQGHVCMFICFSAGSHLLYFLGGEWDWVVEGFMGNVPVSIHCGYCCWIIAEEWNQQNFCQCHCCEIT